jgi:hypothetical protein
MSECNFVIEYDIILCSQCCYIIFFMELPSSETGDNMPTHATDATPITSGTEEDVAKQSLRYGEVPR